MAKVGYTWLGGTVGQYFVKFVSVFVYTYTLWQFFYYLWVH